MINIRSRTVFIFLFLLSLIVYSNSLTSPFYHDDIYYLKENLNIKSFKVFLDGLSKDYSSIFTGRPFLLFTFFLNYKLGGLDTFGYHLLNLLIHIVNAFLLYLLLFKYAETDNPLILPLERGGKGGFKKDYSLKYALAAVIFLIHPINTESVTYISSRSSVLSAFFVLASILAFFKATAPPHPSLSKDNPPTPPLEKGGEGGFDKRRQEGGKSKFNLFFYILSMLFFILGLSTKEAAVVLPALLILFDYFFISRNSKNLLLRIKYYLPYLIIIGLLSILYMGYITSPMPQAERPWSTHIFTEIRVFVKYLRLLLIPIGLNIDHDVRPSISFDSHVIFSLLIVLTLIFVSIFLKKKNPVISFSILWFFVNMIPFLAVKLNDFMAERWVYLASIGYCVGIAEAIRYLFNKKNYRIAGIAVTIATTIFLGTSTVLRNNVYSSPITLWEDAAKKSPDKDRPYLGLSRAYIEGGNLPKAIESAQECIKRGKGRIVIEANINLAAAYEYKGDYEKAVEILKSVERQASNFYEYHYNLGSLYKKRGEYEKALLSFKKALKLRPSSSLILFSIGECYENFSHDEKAKEYFIEATKVIPQTGGDYLGQGMSFLKLREDEKAIECFFEAVKTDPLDVNVRMYLSNALLKLGHYDIAFKHYSIAAKISPHYAPAYKGMGLAMLAKGNLKEARKHFNRALSLLPPDSPERKELLELLTKTQG